MRRSKYGAKPKVVDGIKFASTREAERYVELKAEQQAGLISGLELQPEYLLLPAQRRPDGKAERAIHYVADFRYRRGDASVVEDVKGLRTRDYVIKRKLMLSVHGIAVQEIK